MASLLHLSPRKHLATGLNYSEMPKTKMDQTELRPTRIFPDDQKTFAPFSSAPKQNPDSQDHKSASVKELSKSHLSKMSIKLGNPTAQPEPAQHKPASPTNPQPDSRLFQQPVLHLPQIATTSDTKPIGSVGVAHKKEAVTMDLG